MGNRKRLIFAVFTLFVILLSGSGSSYHYFPMDKSIPLVTFIFDDGNDTDYIVAKDIFDAHGDVACSAITTDWINTKNHLNVSQLTELQNNGWEILSHTVSHPNLKTLPESQVETELAQSKATLEGLGLTVKNLAYPYNKNNYTIREVAKKHYRAGRSGHNMLNPPTILDQYDLKAYSSNHPLSKLEGHVDKAYSEKKWLILYHHRIEVKIKISGKTGNFIPGENLTFNPSGATGKYISDKNFVAYGSAMHLVPISGTPQANDIITGQSSGAACNLDRVDYNQEKALIELIEYIHTKYPDMRIVTIDKGLDIYL